MNLTKTLPAVLPIAALPLLAFVGRADKVTFEPSEGASTSKEMSFSSTFYLDDMRIAMDGNELPAEMMGGAMDEGLLLQATIAVTDEYVSSREGKVLTLLRSFDELTLEAGVESEAEIVDEFAELEDTTVSFQWDDEEDDYVKTFHESDGDEALLENLDPDMDFMVLLPDGEVSEGDTWEASGERLGSVFLPGGVPANPSADEEEAEEMAELFQEEMEAQMSEAFSEFVLNCTYEGTRDEDGVTVGVITFKFEGDTSLDLSDMIQEVIDMQAGDAGVEADISATIGFEFEGEGTLLWNLRAGHAHGFDMSGDITLSADMEGDVDAMGESHSMEMSAEVSGEASWEMTTTGGDDE